MFFADYGDFNIVPLMNLQALPDEFKQLPLMAVRGCLHGRFWKETQGLQYTFFAVNFVFTNTDHVTIPRRVFSFKVGHFHAHTHGKGSKLLGIVT